MWNENERLTKSFPVGIVTACEMIEGDEKGCGDEICLPLVNYINELVCEYGVMDVISTAGTATTIAALKEGMNYKTYDGEKINGVIINLTDIESVKATLLECSDALRSELVGVGREKLVSVGIEILTTLLKALKVDRCCVIDDGLREGAAYQGLFKLELRKN
jgi:exopolyphosphatase/guanosine-5'-triphosphate,3'-diphosphate pyrophosphatase